MPEPTKAVFLSYASQDADAARRIADALRATGIEVWFDQSELRGGDAWDHNIRTQIKTCALFMPVISAHTQARPEGYFRLEWRLADQRTHLMGRAKAFLLPVCVDDTKDSDADVPDSFLAVQWIRLRNGEADAAFCDRVKRLLNSGHVAAPIPGPQPHHETPVVTVPAAASRRSRRWWPAALVAVLAIAAGLWWWRAPADGPVTSPLVAQVWEQLNKAELARAELDNADDLARQATEAEPRNAVAWAAWSQVESWYVYHNLDASAARREGARAKAARAIQLAPASYEAQLARACQLVRGQGDRAQSLYATEAGELLRTLLRERTDEPRALLALGILQRNTGDTAGACETFGRLAGNPAFAALAWNETGWARFFARDIAAAEVAIDRSIAIQPYWGNLTLKTFIAQYWSGDLDRAKDALERIPASVRQEDLGVSLAAELFFWRREPEAMLRVLDEVPRDWLQSNTYDGPKAHYVALAHELAGRHEAARLHWQRALDLVQRRLADQPDSNLLQHWKGHLLAYLGQRPEAEDALRLAREMGPAPEREFGVGVDRILLGQFDDALTALEKVGGTGALPPTAAAFRLNPRYDPIREQPRFQAVCERLESDPRTALRAAPQSADSGEPAATSASTASSPAARPPAVALTQKSIAVLPFANRTADPNHAFFTDGIHDDLLTQVSRIKSIKTISRTSVLGYRTTTKNIRQIGEELGVATILEGGVQRAGDAVRINVQLIDARTDTHLWAERYDRKLSAENVFAIQSEIATAIASALQAVLTPEEKRQFEELPTQNLAALEAFFKAKANDDSAAQTAQAITHLQQAIALDPDFAEAHALLGDQLLRQVWTDGLPEVTQVAKAQPHVERALALAPLSSNAHVALGYLRNRQDDADGAVVALRHAIELNPNNASAVAFLGYVQLWGRRDAVAAVESYRRALELDPLSPLIRQQMVEALTADGRFDEARARLDRLLQENPNYVEALRNYGELQESAFYRLDEAIKAYRRAVALDPRNPHFATKLAIAHFTLEDHVAARFWLESAFALAPESRETDFLTGMMRLIEGDREAALTHFRRVPSDTAFHGLARILQSRAALDDGRAEAVAAGLATLAPLAGPITSASKAPGPACWLPRAAATRATC